MLRRTTALVAAIALSTSSAFAGGLSPMIDETPVMEEAVASAGPSINPTYVVLGVLAALLIASSVGGDDDDDTEVGGETDEKEPPVECIKCEQLPPLEENDK